MRRNKIIKIENSTVYVDVSTRLSSAYTLISVEDLHIITESEFSWIASLLGGNLYVRRSGSVPLLHTLILPTAIGVRDHINRNTLDNRRENLRIVTHKQNSLNANLTKTNRSGYKGVYKSSSRKFTATCCGYRIGAYYSAEEAAIAYDTYAENKYGKFTATNKSLGLLK